jgi:hypothetical protein
MSTPGWFNDDEMSLEELATLMASITECFVMCNRAVVCFDTLLTLLRTWREKSLNFKFYQTQRSAFTESRKRDDRDLGDPSPKLTAPARLYSSWLWRQPPRGAASENRRGVDRAQATWVRKRQKARICFFHVSRAQFYHTAEGKARGIDTSPVFPVA